MVGRLVFREDGDLIDCSKVRVRLRRCHFANCLLTQRAPQMGIGGKAIPPNIDKVEDMQSDAEFILLVRALQPSTSVHFMPAALQLTTRRCVCAGRLRKMRRS